MWALVEVQRRFGGMAPRAVVGGESVVDAGTEAVFEVLVGADYDSLVEHGRQSGSAVASRIYDDWPFMAGLPAEYAASALNRLAGGGFFGPIVKSDSMPLT
jgi:hypothetical protein